MKKVEVPYTIQDGQLALQQLAWPQQCICCKGAETVEHTLHHLAEKTELRTDVSVETKGYPLSWTVRYCKVCLKHADRVEKVFYAICVAVPLLWVLFGYLLYDRGLAEDPVGIGLFIVSLPALIAAGYAVYKLVVNTWIKSMMTPTCAHHDDAVEVSSYRVTGTTEGRVVFSFYDDDYAAAFAAMNGVPVAG